jgi:hypothetical protein
VRIKDGLSAHNALEKGLIVIAGNLTEDSLWIELKG